MTEKLLSGFILVTMTLLSMPARSAEYEYEKPKDYETVTVLAEAGTVSL